jgi:hypothetical protein
MTKALGNAHPDNLTEMATQAQVEKWYADRHDVWL